MGFHGRMRLKDTYNIAVVPRPKTPPHHSPITPHSQQIHGDKTTRQTKKLTLDLLPIPLPTYELVNSSLQQKHVYHYLICVEWGKYPLSDMIFNRNCEGNNKVK